VKYLVSWKLRGGGSGSDNEADAERGLKAFAAWKPAADTQFHQFLSTLDAEGGYAVVETDNPASLMDGPAKFAPWFEFTVVPVVDITEAIPAFNEAIEFRKGVG
jgi:hypothetical protein